MVASPLVKFATARPTCWAGRTVTPAASQYLGDDAEEQHLGSSLVFRHPARVPQAAPAVVFLDEGPELVHGRVEQTPDASVVVHLHGQRMGSAVVARRGVPGHQALLVAPEVVGPGRRAFHLVDVGLEQLGVATGQRDDLALRQLAQDVGVQLGPKRSEVSSRQKSRKPSALMVGSSRR